MASRRADDGHGHVHLRLQQPRHRLGLPGRAGDARVGRDAVPRQLPRRVADRAVGADQHLHRHPQGRARLRLCHAGEHHRLSDEPRADHLPGRLAAARPADACQLRRAEQLLLREEQDVQPGIPAGRRRRPTRVSTGSSVPSTTTIIPSFASTPSAPASTASAAARHRRAATASRRRSRSRSTAMAPTASSTRPG